MNTNKTQSGIDEKLRLYLKKMQEALEHGKITKEEFEKLDQNLDEMLQENEIDLEEAEKDSYVVESDLESEILKAKEDAMKLEEALELKDKNVEDTTDLDLEGDEE